MANEQGATLIGQAESAEQVVTKAKTARDIALARLTPGWHTIPVAFSDGDETWTITNGEGPSFIGGDSWSNTDGAQVVTGDFTDIHIRLPSACKTTLVPRP